MSRSRAWLVTSPVVAAGVLAAHSLAYRLTATPTDPVHAYLAHAPQVLLVLGIVGLAIAGFGARVYAPPACVFPVVALVTFIGQEHLERLAHGDGLLSLVASPAFISGLAMQLPVALIAWVLARWLLAAVCEGASRVPPRPRFTLRPVALPVTEPGSIEVRIPPVRGPPELLLPG